MWANHQKICLTLKRLFVSPDQSHTFGDKYVSFLNTRTMSNTSMIRHLKVLISILFFVTMRGHANVVGADSQNFNPITSGLDFVTVHSSETLDPGIINFGLFLNYGVNSLPYFEGDGTTKKTKFNDSLLGSDLNLGIGIMRGWDAGVSFPQVLSQDIEDDDGSRLKYGDLGITEMRANTKVRLTGDKNHGSALVGSVNFNTTKDNPFTGKNAQPTYNLELAMDTTAGKWALGANMGYRWRNSGSKLTNIPIEPFLNQYIASVAASYLFPSIDTKIIFEIFGSAPAKSKDSNFNRKQSSAEFLMGLKHDFSSSLAGHLGAGTELAQGAGSPDYRIYIGINYTMGPLFSQPEPARVAEPVIAENSSDAELAISAGDPYAGGLLDSDEPEILDGKSIDAIFAKTPVPGNETFLLGDILFDFNKDTLVPEAKVILNKLSAYVMKPPAYSKLVIEGHTDSIGSNTYNQDLSERRARSVQRYLTQVRNLEPSTVEAYGYGETKPIADNGNYQGRVKNRRVEMVISRPRPGASEAMPGYSEERIRPKGDATRRQTAPNSQIKKPAPQKRPGAKPPRKSAPARNRR